MRFLGSKARFAASILGIVLAGRAAGQTYVEPFIGGANTFHLVSGPKIGGDSNEFLAAMWGAVANGWCPPEHVTIAEYQQARIDAGRTENRVLDDATIGFIGFGCSFGGKWFGGYARGGFNADGSQRIYARESARAVMNQAHGLVGSQIYAAEYHQLVIPPASLIYCDPPYAGTTGYRDGFDSSRFWLWCDQMRHAGHVIFVSEYEAPPNWRVVWEKETLSSVSKESRSRKRSREKLFYTADG